MTFQEDRITYLVDLFQSIDVKEKGIEDVYDLLLERQSVEDIKEFVDNTGMSLKRVYKVIQLLEKLGLIQVYNRPMIVNIKDPVPSWETIISEKIKEIRTEADNRIDSCEHSFKSFIDNYQLGSEDISVPPVEFINITQDEYGPDFFTGEIIGEAKKVKIAKGDRITTPSSTEIFKMVNDAIVGDTQGMDRLRTSCTNWNKIFPTFRYEVLITEEYLAELLQAVRKEGMDAVFSQLSGLFDLSTVEIRVTPNVLTNFILKDRKELLQYSNSPNNELLGMFISKQAEICEIFNSKFNEEFQNAIKIEKYFINTIKKPLEPFVQFLLALL